MTSEGGWEAAIEAPHIYAAIDALAARAAAWTERRQRALLEAQHHRGAGGGVPAEQQHGLAEPEDAGRAAAAAVKQVPCQPLLRPVFLRLGWPRKIPRRSRTPSLLGSKVSGCSTF